MCARRSLTCLALGLTLAGPAPAAGPPGPRVDRLGDPLPAGAIARLGEPARMRVSGVLNEVALAPDGKLGAAVSGEKNVYLWEMPSGKVRAMLKGVTGSVEAVAFSHDGRLLATTDTQAKAGLCLWDTTSGKLLHSVTLSARPWSLAFSPDGRSLAGTVPREGVFYWEVATAKLSRNLADDECESGLAFAADGKTLASGRLRGGVALWDVKTGRRRRALPGGGGRVMDLAFSADGARLAAAAGPAIRVWDAADGKEVGHFDTGKSKARAVRFADGGKAVVGVANWQQVRRWDLASGASVLLWRNKYPEGPQFPIGPSAFSADGKFALVCQINASFHPRLIDLARKKELTFSGRKSPVNDLAYSPDGKLLAAAGRGDAMIHLYDPADGRLVRELSGHAGGVGAVVFSPDGRTLVTGDWGATSEAVGGRPGPAVSLWEVATGRLLRTQAGKTGGVWAMAYSPDGRTIVVGDNYHRKGQSAGRVHLAGPRLDDFRVFYEHPRPVTWLSFSPEGLAVLTLNGEAELWDVGAKKVRHRFGAAARAAHSRDGRLLATSDVHGRVLVYEVLTGRPLFRGKGPLSPVWAMAFRPDGELLAVSGSRDRPVRLLDIATGEDVAPPWGPADPATALAFTPDGNTLATGCYDTTALIWDVRGVGRRPTVRLSPADAARAWADMGSDDAARAYRAIRLLAADPPRAVRHLGQRLRPASRPEGKRLARLVAGLDAEEFSTRDKASAELEVAGRAAEPYLRAALKGKPSLEQLRRVEKLLKRLEAGTHGEAELRSLRAVVALERIGDEAARRVLRRLAGGDEASPLTREAAASLRRLRDEPRTK